MRVELFSGTAADPARLRAAWSALVARSGAAQAVAGMTKGGGWAGVLLSPATPGEAGLLEAALAGPAARSASDDVGVVMAGCPRAGAAFVQLMEARVDDREAWAAVDGEGVARFAAARPDFLGSLRVWQPGGRLTVIDSFTSEADARAGEAVAPPAADQAVYDAWFGHLSDVAWHDLVEPWRD